MRFLTAGESHGKELTVILEGLPSGLPLLAADVDGQLARRQLGVGRGARQKIESDRVEFTAGVRLGETTGGPVCMRIPNKDWKSWTEIMAAEPSDEPPGRPLTLPRPGHADLAGCLKHGLHDGRNILERSSARETAARVAAGAAARRLLAAFGVEIASCVLSVGSVRAAERPAFENCLGLDPELPMPGEAEAEEARRLILEARKAGDTLGGSTLVIVRGLLPGLGSHAHWDRRLDGRLGQALLSIPSAKAVEIGDAMEASTKPGSEMLDPIGYEEGAGFTRPSNRMGGLEGGITNGEELRLVTIHKPVPTLIRPLPSTHLGTKEAGKAHKERSDSCVVVPGAVVAEAMAALVLAAAYGEKFGGDSLAEMKRNWEGYRKQLEAF